MKHIDDELSPQHMIGKILLCTGILLLYMALTCMAAEPIATTRMRPSLPSGWIKLRLSSEQAQKISSIKVTTAAKVKELQAQIATVKEKALEEEVAILTPAQKDMLAELVARKAGVARKPETKP